MNFNNFTIKSQEAVQKAQQITQELGQQQIENAHILKGIIESDENVIPFLLNKLGIIILVMYNSPFCIIIWAKYRFKYGRD